jgi:hypothetical protein
MTRQRPKSEIKGTDHSKRPKQNKPKEAIKGSGCAGDRYQPPMPANRSLVPEKTSNSKAELDDAERVI